MKIGCPAPHFRAPALVEGALTFFDSAHGRGRRGALAFLPTLGLLEGAVLEYQAASFEQVKAALFAVVPERTFLAGPWQREIWPRGLTLLSDPLGRLSRYYGVPQPLSSGRCHSFVMDQESSLRYHLVHDLNGRGMSALLEILKACRSGKSSRPDAPRSVIPDRDKRVQPLLATSTQGE